VSKPSARFSLSSFGITAAADVGVSLDEVTLPGVKASRDGTSRFVRSAPPVYVSGEGVVISGTDPSPVCSVGVAARNDG